MTTTDTNGTAPTLPGKPKMKTEITITKGRGWNSSRALDQLTSAKLGCLRLLARNAVASLTVGPFSDKPLGVAARFFDADGEEMYCLRFDSEDGAGWIKERIKKLLTEGITERRNRLAAQASRKAFIARIRTWRTAPEPVRRFRIDDRIGALNTLIVRPSGLPVQGQFKRALRARLASENPADGLTEAFARGIFSELAAEWVHCPAEAAAEGGAQ